jgi:hypothetical protein
MPRLNSPRRSRHPMKTYPNLAARRRPISRTVLFDAIWEKTYPRWHTMPHVNYLSTKKYYAGMKQPGLIWEKGEGERQRAKCVRGVGSSKSPRPFAARARASISNIFCLLREACFFCACKHTKGAVPHAKLSTHRTFSYKDHKEACGEHNNSLHVMLRLSATLLQRAGVSLAILY